MMIDYARTYFPHCSFIYLFIYFYLCCSKLHTIKKAFPNGFAPVLSDSAYWNTLSAEPKLFPPDDRNLLYNSTSNSGTYCSCFSVPQTRIHLTETTSALKKTPPFPASKRVRLFTANTTFVVLRPPTTFPPPHPHCIPLSKALFHVQEGIPVLPPRCGPCSRPHVT